MGITTKIELFDKVVNETTISVIAECNRYENEIFVAQLSRSPFILPIMTDEEIITHLQNNEYKIYF